MPGFSRAGKKLIHLQLNYDSLNRVISAEVRLGDRLKAFEGFSGNLYINAPLTRVQYDGVLEIHTFYDRFGQPVEVMNQVFQKVYEKDRYGRNIKLFFLDKEGKYTQDQFGFVRYEWEYENNGSVIEQRFNEEGVPGPLRGQFQFIRTRMTYGPEGYPVVLENIDEQGNLLNSASGAAVYRYFYNSFGRFDRWEVYDRDGNPAKGPSGTGGEQNYFHGCYLREIDFFSPEGGPVTHWSGAEKWRMRYDRYGNTTMLQYQDEHRRPKNANNGFAEVRYDWSDDGHYLLSRSYYDKQGEPTNHQKDGIFKTLYLRDDVGNISEVINYKVDINGDILEN